MLAVLGKIATTEQTTVMALLREAARDLVKSRVASSSELAALQRAAWAMAPEMPKRFKTPAQVARFKREQRAFDRALLDMGLASPEAVQERNSIVPSHTPIRITNFAQAHAAAAI